jgi:hypothetical protein
VVAVVTGSTVTPAAGVTHFPPAAGTPAPSEPVCVELSKAQVDKIVGAAAAAGNLSILFSGLADRRAMPVAGSDQMEDSRLSRSLLAGLLMLASFPSDGSHIGIAELGRMLDMNPSTVHRYVSTLAAAGLLEQDPDTRRYRRAAR